MNIAAMELFTDLPPQPAPSALFPLNLYELVPLLVNAYHEWDEEDVVEFIEERTRHRIHPEDLTILRAVYQRCMKLEAEF